MSNSVYRPTDHSAQTWREMAGEAMGRSEESFARCDTDGFLSQAASQAMSSLYRLCAEIAERGGVCEFTGVMDATTGELLEANTCKTRYGYTWRVQRPDGTVAWFRPSTARNGTRRRATDAAKGFLLCTYSAPAVVVPAGWSGGMPLVQRGAERTLIGPLDYQDE